MNKVFNVLREVIQDKELTYLDKTVFTSLITFNGKNKIFPSLLEIGNRINCNSKNNVSASITKLKNKKYIEVIRRFQKSNIYKIREVQTEIENKTTKRETNKIKPVKEPDKTKFMNEAMLETVAGEVAKCKGYSKPENSDYVFVKTILKLKEEDNYENDNFNYVRKCLMFLYLLNVHKDKFQPGNNPYAYFIKVYSLSSYADIKQKIFNCSVKVNEYEVLN